MFCAPVSGDAVVWASTYRQIIECVRAMEAEGTAAPAAVPDELAAGLSAEDARRACLEAILLSFSFVFGTMHVSVREPADPSGGVLAEVGELLQQVASMVVFPSFPLYLALESEPTSDFGQVRACVLARAIAIMPAKQTDGFAVVQRRSGYSIGLYYCIRIGMLGFAFRRTHYPRIPTNLSCQYSTLRDGFNRFNAA